MTLNYKPIPNHSKLEGMSLAFTSSVILFFPARLEPTHVEHPYKTEVKG